MENEKDVFSQGWSDENVVSDERESESLPEGPESGGEAAPESAPSDLPGREVPEGLEREIERFVRAFPGVRGADIPAEVWERVRGGANLTEAYLVSETARLREENDRLRAGRERRELNYARSAGSQTGQSFGETKRDAFEEGWSLLA